VDDVWLNQGLDIDAVTVAALVARLVPRVIVGTAVVPTYPRHPIVLASQAKAAQLAAGGRFALGIGLGHQGQVEGVFGVPFDRPIGHLRDYLRALRSRSTPEPPTARCLDVRVSPAAFATDEERLRTWRLVGELARSSSATGRAAGSEAWSEPS
jgi:alkanesulfonate monooxygenase SsuD/methylene tetrahydromethanopterin reductase-like flavin-dependent oxidoreductase (luciferase family)